MIKHPIETIVDLLSVFEKLNIVEHTDIFGDIDERFFIGKKVIIVGSNPGSESPDNSAFHETTKSGKTVRSWFKDTLTHVHFYNIHAVKGDIKKLPKLSAWDIEKQRHSFEFHQQQCNYKVVACGDYASKQLDLMKVKHLKMPHPSGLNRFWNNKEAGEAKIKEMLEWVKNGN